MAGRQVRNPAGVHRGDRCVHARIDRVCGQRVTADAGRYARSAGRWRRDDGARWPPGGAALFGQSRSGARDRVSHVAGSGGARRRPGTRWCHRDTGVLAVDLPRQHSIGRGGIPFGAQVDSRGTRCGAPAPGLARHAAARRRHRVGAPRAGEDQAARHRLADRRRGRGPRGGAARRRGAAPVADGVPAGAGARAAGPNASHHRGRRVAVPHGHHGRAVPAAVAVPAGVRLDTVRRGADGGGVVRGQSHHQALDHAVDAEVRNPQRAAGQWRGIGGLLRSCWPRCTPGCPSS